MNPIKNNDLRKKYAPAYGDHVSEGIIIQNSSSPINTRTIPFSKHEQEVTTINKLLQEVLYKYETSQAPYVETSLKLSNLALEYLGHPTSQDDISLLSDQYLDSISQRFLRGIKNKTHTIVSNDLTGKLITSCSPETAIIHLSTEIAKFKTHHAGKNNISCADLKLISNIASAVQPIEGTDKSLSVRANEIRMLMYAISHSDGTMTAAMNSILHCFEDFLTTAKASDLATTEMACLYINALAQYINLAVGRSISVASLSKQKITSSVEKIQTLLSNPEILGSAQMAPEASQSISVALANLVKVTYGIGIKSSNGPTTTKDVRTELSKIFFCASKTISEANTTKINNPTADNVIIPSELQGIIALGLLVSAEKNINLLTPFANLGLASHNVKFLLNDFTTTSNKFIKATTAAGEIHVNIISQTGSIRSQLGDITDKAALDHNRYDAQFCECHYNSIKAYISENIGSILKSGNTTILSHALRTLAILRYHISEIDEISANNSVIQQYANRGIYGVNDKDLEIIVNHIIQSMKTNSYSSSQLLDLTDSIARICQIHYAKYRNKPPVSTFVHREVAFQKIVNSITYLAQTANFNIREALKTFLPRVTNGLLWMENTDQTTSPEAILRTSKELMKLELVQKAIEIEQSISTGDNLHDPRSTILPELRAICAAYVDEFIMGDKAKAAKTIENILDAMYPKSNIFGAKGLKKSSIKSPSTSASKISTMLSLSEYLKLKAGSETHVNIELTRALDNAILKSILDLPEEIRSPSDAIVNRVEMTNQVKFSIANELSRMKNSSASVSSFVTQNNIAILYIGALINGDQIAANALANQFQQMEHQPGDICVTIPELNNVASELKSIWVRSKT